MTDASRFKKTWHWAVDKNGDTVAVPGPAWPSVMTPAEAAKTRDRAAVKRCLTTLVSVAVITQLALVIFHGLSLEPLVFFSAIFSFVISSAIGADKEPDRQARETLIYRYPDAVIDQIVSGLVSATTVYFRLPGNTKSRMSTVQGTTITAETGPTA